MDPITMILTAISGIKLILNNPALGGGSSVRLDEASALLGILATLIEQGDDGLDDLREFTALIQTMVKESRPPTQVEWDTWQGRSDAAHDRLQRVKAELLGEEDPDPEPEEKRQAIVDEIAALEAIADDERTQEQWDRLDELTAPPEPE